MRRIAERVLPFAIGLWATGALFSEGVAAAGMIGTALCAFALRDDGIDWKPWTLLLGFVLWALLAPSLAGRFPTGTGAARLLNLLAIPIAAAGFARLSPRAVRAVVIALGVVLTISCTIAALQHFGAWPSPETLQPLTALKVPISRMYEEVPGEPGHYMGGGLGFHRLKFAHVGGLAMLGLGAAALVSRGRERLLAGIAAAFSFVAILWFPYTRAAAVSLAVSVAALLALGLRVSRRMAILVGGGVVVTAVAVLLLIPGFRERLLASTTTEGSGDRAAIHAAGLSAVKAHPWVGTGVGRFKLVDYVPPDSPVYVLENPGKAHNQLLSVAAESGIPAALLFVAMLAMLARRLWNVRFNAPFGIASLLFFVMLSAAHDPIFHAEFGMALALSLGAALGLRSAPAADVAPEVHPVERDTA